MSRLPIPGQDDGQWGDILNDYLLQSHNADGTPKDIAQSKVTNLVTDLGTIQSTADQALTTAQQAASATIADGSVTVQKLSAPVQSSLAKADSALQVAPVTSVASKTGAVTLVKADVGLTNVDDTSDANKPVSTATQTALNSKVDVDTAQSLTLTQQTTARTNIGAASPAEIQTSFKYNPSVPELSAMPAGTYYVTGA